MSWGPGQYIDCCLKVIRKIEQLELTEQEKVNFLNKKYKYVKTVCNPGSKEDFFLSCGLKINNTIK